MGLINSKLQNDVTFKEKVEKSTVLPSMDFILKNSGEGIIVLNRQWEFVYLNNQAERLLSMRTEYVLGENYWEIFVEQIGSDYDIYFNLAMDTQEPVAFEHFHAETNGHFGIRAYPTKDFLYVFARDLTDHYLISERARQGDEYRNLFRHSNDPILILSPNDETILDVNNKACEVYDFKREEFIGMSLLDISVQPNKQKEKINEVLEKGQVVEFETVHLSSDGQPKHFAVTPSLITFYGKPAILSINRDITQNKQDLDLIRETEARFYSAFTFSANGMAVVSAQGKFLQVNQALCQLVGYSENELVNLTLLDITHPDDLKHDWEDLQLLYLGEYLSYITEKRFIHKNGNDIWVFINMAAVRDSEGNVEYTIAQIQDVSKTKSMEKELEKQQMYLRQVIDTTPLAIAVKDQNGKFVLANNYLANLYDKRVEQLIGSRLEDQLNFIDHQIVDQYSLIADQGEIIVSEETFVDIITNSKRWFQTRRVPFKLKNDDSYFELSVATEITELKDAEFERQSLENQLMQTQKLDSIGTLAGGVAHDFNNLLTAILGYSELSMRMVKDNPQLFNHIKNVKLAAEKATVLTKRLLVFSRRQILERTIIDLNRLVQDLMEMIQRIIGEHIEICLNLTETSQTIYADQGQIEQVLMNLAINSRDAMIEGGKLSINTKRLYLDGVFCSQHPDLSAGDFVCLTVVDNGIGMSKEVLERIFEPFFTTKDVDKGTGLGLAMVYGIIKQHNGFIEVHSEPDAGTIFNIYLPLVKPSSIENPVKQINSSPIIGGEETILVVEDEDSLRYFLKNLLETLGYQVLLATNGVEGIEQYQTNKDKIDLIMLDIVMPQMSGVQVYEEIRNQINDSLPIIFMTGYSIAQTQQRIGEYLKADKKTTLINKPYSINQLCKVLRQMIEQV